MEKRSALDSSRVIAISEDFMPVLESWEVPRNHMDMIPNWASLADLPTTPKTNAWSLDHGLADRFVFLYSGTLGLKHDPELLLDLAKAWRTDPEVRVVVISEGLGADWLRKEASLQCLSNILILPYQAPDRYAEVLGSADVLTAVLDEAAGQFSVPSKVLSYHCAARPILAAIPKDNQAARLIEEVGSGIVVAAGDSQAFLDASTQLRTSADERQFRSDRGRAYAVATFDISAIGSRFDQLLRSVATRESGRSDSPPQTHGARHDGMQE
jgi:glycosyltransferase involved in cell wall biosynthesis